MLHVTVCLSGWTLRFKSVIAQCRAVPLTCVKFADDDGAHLELHTFASMRVPQVMSSSGKTRRWRLRVMMLRVSLTDVMYTGS